MEHQIAFNIVELDITLAQNAVKIKNQIKKSFT